MQFGNTRFIRKTPTVTAGAYSAGDMVGGGIDFGEIGTVTRRGLLKSLSIVDRSNQKAVLTILFFEGELAGSYADNGVPSIAAADQAKFVGKVEIAASDYTTIGSVAFCTKEVAIPIGSSPSSGNRRLSAIVLCTATPTYATTTALDLILGVLGD